MAGHAREQRPRGGLSERDPGERCRREHRRQAEAGQEQRMARRPDHRSEQRRGEALPLAGERSEQAGPCVSVTAHVPAHGFEIAFQDDAPAGSQRVREGCLGLDPLEPVAGQVERPEEGRRHAQRVNRGADVVDEAWERQLRGPGPAADLVGRFVDPDLPPGARELDGCGKSVGTRADDDGVQPVTAATPGRHRELRDGRAAISLRPGGAAPSGREP